MSLKDLKLYQKGTIFFLIVWIIIFGYFKMIKIAMAGMIAGIIIFALMLFVQKYYYPDSEVSLELQGKKRTKHSVKEKGDELVGDEISIIPSAEDLGLPSAEEYNERAIKALGIK